MNYTVHRTHTCDIFEPPLRVSPRDNKFTRTSAQRDMSSAVGRQRIERLRPRLIKSLSFSLSEVGVSHFRISYAFIIYLILFTQI